MFLLLDKSNSKLVGSEVGPIRKREIPSKRNGWKFDWQGLFKQKNSNIYALRLLNLSGSVEGAILLKIESNMLIMDVLELAPRNIGRGKCFDHVAGVLIAFACRESFKIEGDYKGFLTFVSKTNLINWYRSKYGAESVGGQRMYIDWENGQKLIGKYLKRSEDEKF